MKFYKYCIVHPKFRRFLALMGLIVLYVIMFVGYGLLLQILWRLNYLHTPYLTKHVGFILSILFGVLSINTFNQYNNSIIATIIDSRSGLLFKSMYCIGVCIMFIVVWFFD